VDPVTALVVAFIVTSAIMRAAGQAAADQARVEAARAADAIRADIRGRRTAAARRLSARLEAGRAAGPVYPMWWAWAAVRAAGGLRRGARQRRREAERRLGPSRSTTGPLGRILGAALRGAAYGWRESRRQYREARAQGHDDRRRPPDVGVCERCGAVTALAALAEAPTRLGRRARMCARCRAQVDVERRLDAEPDPAPAAPPADVTDADVVDDPAEIPAARPAGQVPPAAAVCARCGVQLVAFGCVNPECPLSLAYRGPLAIEGAPEPAQFRLPVRYCADCHTQLSPHTWWARNADNADVCLFCARGSGGRPGRYADSECRQREPAELAAIGTPIGADGRPCAVSPGLWRQLASTSVAAAAAAAPAAPEIWDTAPGSADDSRPDAPAGPHDQAAAPAALPAPAQTGDSDVSCNGEMHTQADWASQSAGILAQLDGITGSAENMLKCLTAKEASRSQMTAAAAWADQVAAVAARGRELVDEVNQRQDPYVDAVQGAGGSDEVAVPDYYAEM